jgi:FixJ family two-component response regulator
VRASGDSKSGRELVAAARILTRIKQSGVDTPVILVTGHADVQMTVRAVKAGVIDFFEEPFRDNDLLDSVSRAIALEAQRWHSLVLTIGPVSPAD